MTDRGDRCGFHIKGGDPKTLDILFFDFSIGQKEITGSKIARPDAIVRKC